MPVCWLSRPYPVINIIADQPSRAVGSAKMIQEERQHERKRAIAAAAEMASNKKDAALGMAEQDDMLARLALLGVSAWGENDID